MARQETKSRKTPATSFGSCPKTRVLLVDDHPIVREGLIRVLSEEPDLFVCGEAGDGRQAMQTIADLKPDVAIVDVSLDGSHGIDLVKNISAQYPEVKVLMLSVHDESLYAERAVRAGAKGYVMKTEPTEKLLQALRLVIQGRIYLSQAYTLRVLNRFAGKDAEQTLTPIETLSDRELEVLEMLGQGHRTREIADQLHLSAKTIQTYREHLKDKLNLPDGVSLMRFAVQWSDSGEGAALANVRRQQA